MSSIHVIPYLPEHIAAIDNPRHDANLLHHMDENYPMQLFHGGPALTGVVDKKIIGCCGIIKIHAGVGQAWLIGGHSIEEHKLSFHVLTKRGLKAIQDQERMHRVQCAVRSDAPGTWHKWIEALGFVRECVMARFCVDRSDATLYARILGG